MFIILAHMQSVEALLLPQTIPTFHQTSVRERHTLVTSACLTSRLPFSELLVVFPTTAVIICDGITPFRRRSRQQVQKRRVNLRADTPADTMLSDPSLGSRGGQPLEAEKRCDSANSFGHSI